MVIEQELQKLFQNLVHEQSASIALGDLEVIISIVDAGAKAVFSTDVYSGENYIPSSVRIAVETPPPFSSKFMQTTLSLDEDEFKVFLKYIDSTDRMNTERLRITLEEFAWLADNWRDLLEEEDKKDRVRIPLN